MIRGIHKFFWGVVLCVHSAFAAEPPIVSFDVATVIPCREVLTCPVENRSRKLVEAIVKISASIESGAEKDLKWMVYTIADYKSEKTISVAEFLPNTELYTDVVDPVVVLDASESGVSGSLAATYRMIPAPVGAVELGADVEGTQSTQSSVQYKKLAPKEVLVSSGTKDRRHAVYYKLKPSSQTTLEGERVFSVVLEVPHDWCADWVYIRCEAVGRKRGVLPFFDSEVQCGLAGFSVGLYLEGNPAARNGAEQLALEQKKYFTALAEETKAGDSSLLASVWDWLWFFDKLRPICMAPASNAYLEDKWKEKPAGAEELPTTVMKGLQGVNEAKLRLGRLSGSQHR